MTIMCPKTACWKADSVYPYETAPDLGLHCLLIILPDNYGKGDFFIFIKLF